MSIEETYVKHIECGIRAIKLRTKKPEEANVGKYLNKLKELNDGLYDDLLTNYKKILADYKKEQEKFVN